MNLLSKLSILFFLFTASLVVNASDCKLNPKLEIYSYDTDKTEIIDIGLAVEKDLEFQTWESCFKAATKAANSHLESLDDNYEGFFNVYTESEKYQNQNVSVNFYIEWTFKNAQWHKFRFQNTKGKVSAYTSFFISYAAFGDQRYSKSGSQI